MVKIGIHQANFIPWVPFFYKMAQCDIFVILRHTQFRKGGFENRYNLSNGEWVTKPVIGGIDYLIDKKYADGTSLIKTNMLWINAIKETLNINTKIEFDFPTNKRGTDRLIEIIKFYGGDIYLTNENAKDKYLDEEAMRSNGISIEYCQAPKHLHLHTFEAFEKIGIDSLSRQLSRKEELCEI